MPFEADFIHSGESGALFRLRFRWVPLPGTLAFLEGPGHARALEALAGRSLPRGGFIRFGQVLWFFGQGGLRLEATDRPLVHIHSGDDLGLVLDKSVDWHLYRALAGWPGRSWNSRRFELLNRSGLGDLAKARVSRLTIHQQRLLAVVLAVAAKPALLLVDGLFDDLDRPGQRRLLWDLRLLLREEGIAALAGVGDAGAFAKGQDRVLATEALSRGAAVA
jgi:ABC-type glutathione transport system ATPase component